MKKIKVFFLDDEEGIGEVMRELINLILSNFGFEDNDVCVETFICAEDAKECIQKGEIPDIIITDVDMSEMSGIDFLKISKNLHPDIRFIVMSGEDYEKDALKNGADFFLLKPLLGVEDFAEMLKSLLPIKKE